MSAPSPAPVLEPSSPCPCGSGRTFGACCAPLLRGERRAETAEQLMRSRFTAHVVRDYRYLHRTYLETSRREYLEENDSVDFEWTRLVVHPQVPHGTGAGPADTKPD